jgi:site-specific DNA-methyltransferase (adenine-specific)
METNKVYCMDNLELLKQLPDNSIDLIYCDILYGTGRDFGDYQDLPYNKESIYEFYESRVKELHRILKPTGTMILQMDFRISHWLRCISDDSFGYKNCTNVIEWCYSSGGSSSKRLSVKNDTLIVYAKDVKKQKFHPKKEKSYNRGGKPYRFKGVEEFQDDEGKWYTMVGMKQVWHDIPMVGRTSSERVGYQTQKPKKLLKRIIELYSSKGDIVADFFCGSGTTLVVAKELEREYIGCDIEENAIEITEKRLRGEL